MKKHLFLLTLLLLNSSAFAQQISPDSIDTIFSEWNQTDVPGGAVAVIQNGEIVFSKGYGLADMEHDIVIHPSTVFYIGSVSKQFVTFSILLLEEQGKLDLDDEIQEFLPDFPKYEAPLTIRHFIHHTSGVRDYLTLMNLKGRSYLDHTEMEEAYELIKNQDELNFTPGERYLYSNSCYLMLAMIVEKAAGMSIKEFAEKEIFSPLGMDDTQFYDDITDLVKNRAFSYARTDGGFDNLVSRFDLVGSGGIYSTVEDLYLWDQNFYDNQLGEGHQAIIDTMLTDGRLNNGDSSGYAFALVNGNYRGLKTVSHSGSLAGYRAYYTRFPDQEFSVIILSNRNDGNPSNKAYQIADLYLSDQLETEQPLSSEQTESDKTPVQEPLNLDQITGDYLVNSSLLISFSVEQDSLMGYEHWNDAAYSLSQLEGNTYLANDGTGVTFTFESLEDGHTFDLVINVNGNQMRGTRADIRNLTADDLLSYSGLYYSPELDVNYELMLKEEKLHLKIGFNSPEELTPIPNDEFLVGNRMLRFERDQNGELEGFRLDAGRVTNLKFMKQ